MTDVNKAVRIKNFSKLFLFFIGFVALGVVGAYLFSEKIDLGIGMTGKVPLLKGKTVAEAGELLNRRKLVMNIKGEESTPQVPEGQIIRQLVEAGKKLGAGSEVGVIVSRSKTAANISIPSFISQRLSEAKRTLTNLDIKLGKVTWVHSDTAEKEKIIAQRPLPGSMDPTEINFLVSLGPYDVLYRCPSFINMATDEARDLAARLGIDLVEKGGGSKIVLQTPAEGEMIRKGDSVEVTLGSGRWMWF